MAMTSRLIISSLILASNAAFAVDLTQQNFPARSGVVLTPASSLHVVGAGEQRAHKPDIVWIVISEKETPMQAMDRVEETARQAEIAALEEAERIRAEEEAAAMPVSLKNDKVLFESGQYRSVKMGSLSELLKIALAQPNTQLNIVGHTDSVGSDAGNQQLGFKRAEFVARWLAKKGVSGSRMQVSSNGESDPIADNEKAHGRAKNRRSEVTVWIRAGDMKE